jgi:hypothetical protein
VGIHLNEVWYTKSLTFCSYDSLRDPDCNHFIFPSLRSEATTISLISISQHKLLTSCLRPQFSSSGLRSKIFSCCSAVSFFEYYTYLYKNNNGLAKS